MSPFQSSLYLTCPTRHRYNLEREGNFQLSTSATESCTACPLDHDGTFTTTACPLPACPDAGESMIVCDEAYSVFEETVTLADDLAVDGEIKCYYTYVLTAGDVDNLERRAIGTVIAKDVYDYQVVASDTETVSLSQVFCL